MSDYRTDLLRFPWLDTQELDGKPFYFLMTNERSENWYRNGVPGLSSYLDLIHTGMTVIDCGANEGYQACAAALRVGSTGRVIALEPAIHNQEPLKINRHLNGLHHMEIHRMAASDEHGEVLFSGEMVGQGDLVPCVPIDFFINTAPDVIKIDVEGYECKVLRGAQRIMQQYHPVIFLEAHLGRHVHIKNFGDSQADIMKLVWKYGYKGYHVDGRELTDPEEMPNGVVILR
jgi:FkbM family methyltransferase